MVFEGLRGREELLKFLFCCGLVEERISNAYKSLASRIDDVYVKLLLEYISDDSLKHSRILIGVSRYLGVENVDLEECGRIVGSVALRIIEDAERTASKTDRITVDKLLSEFDDLVDLEKYFGEEYLNMIQLKLLEATIEQEKIEVGFLKEILEYITEDERRHEKILKTIKSYPSQKR